MTDPLNDPRFPNRPTHPDFWRLSEAVLWLDGQAGEGKKSLEEIAEGMIDPDSLGYMALTRVAMALAKYTSPVAVYLDAFLAGVRFQQQGGHQ